MRVDGLDVPKLGVVEPPWDLEARQVGHAARAKTGDELGRYLLAANALARDGTLDHRVQLLLANAGETPLFGVFGDVLVGSLGNVADVEDHAEINGAGLEASGVAVVCKGVLESIAGGVIALTAGAGDASAGGEKDEKV